MAEEYKMTIKDLDLYYGSFQALKKVNMDIEKNKITALIGPSGCGKSTFLKTLNRMNDLEKGVRIEGEVCLASEAGRHGLPAAQPLPQVHLR